MRTDHAREKIRGDRLVLATISVLRTPIHELSARGIMDQAAFVTKLDDCHYAP
jgi:hypothetical protein